MKLIEKLKKLARNKTFIAWLILVVIVGIIILVSNKKISTNQEPYTLPLSPGIESDYKILKINPLKISEYGIDIGQKYIVSSKLKEPNSSIYIISLYDLKTGKVTNIGETYQKYKPMISDNYVYWVGNENQIRYDINTKNTWNFDAPYIWNDVFKSKIVYLESLEKKNWMTVGDLNRLVIYDTETKEKINLPEDGYQKNYIKMSGSYVVWINDPWSETPKIKYYSINTGNIKEFEILQRKGINDLDFYNNTAVYISGSYPGCVYTYNIDIKKESKIFCGSGWIREPQIYGNKIIVKRTLPILEENPNLSPENETLLIEL